MNACIWCGRSTHLGRPQGFRLPRPELAEAKACVCIECADRYETELQRIRNEMAETISAKEEWEVRNVRSL